MQRAAVVPHDEIAKPAAEGDQLIRRQYIVTDDQDAISVEPSLPQFSELRIAQRFRQFRPKDLGTEDGRQAVEGEFYLPNRIAPSVIRLARRRPLPGGLCGGCVSA